MKRFTWQVWVGIALVILSIFFYVIHYAVFRDPHHIFIYMVGDIAFVFFEVLLVTMVIHRLFSEREKRIKLEKLNMVVGAFFSEIGTRLLARFSDLDPGLDEIKKHLIVTGDWSEHEFISVRNRLIIYNYRIDIQKVDLEDLRNLLLANRDFLLRLLESPNLLEHESFTRLLQAVFHLVDELTARKQLSQLPASDLAHIADDIKRAYTLLARQWLEYMKHLKDIYPYLFSLAMRTNPFDETSSPVVQ